MKCLRLLVGSALCAASLFAAKGDIYTGVVVDVLNGGGYTYLEIEDSFKKHYWAALEGVAINKGTEVRFSEEMRVKNFESKSLNRTFEDIIFASNLQYRTDKPEKGNLALITEVVKESPYQQKDTLSVKEAIQNRASLNNKPIAIRGKVVKVSPNIMERNFIHIQDGTGEGNEVGRIVFTSKELPKVGDIVTARGIVSVDKNFGSGYMYAIIVESATFNP